MELDKVNVDAINSMLSDQLGKPIEPVKPASGPAIKDETAKEPAAEPLTVEEPEEPEEPEELEEPVEPTEPAKPIEKPKTAEELLKEDNDNLRKLVNELSGRVASGAPVSPASPGVLPGFSPSKPGVGVVTPAQPGVSPAPSSFVPDWLLTGDALKQFNEAMQKDEILQIFSKEDLDQIIDKPQIIQEKVASALNSTKKKTAELVMSVLPYVVNSMVQQTMVAKSAVDSFYDTNKDLNSFRPYVKTVFEHLFRTEQDETVKNDMSKLFAKTAEKVRKDLRLPDPSATPVKQPKPKPAFPAQKGTGRHPRKEASSADTTQKSYIEKMIEEAVL